MRRTWASMIAAGLLAGLVYAAPARAATGCDRIVYVTHRGELSALATVSPSGEDRQLLTRFTEGGWHRPAWSPDGRRIAFLKDTATGSDVFVMSASGKDRMRVTRSAGFEEDVAWLPDSSGLVFERFGDGARAGIYATDLSSGTESFVVDGYHPDVRPDGSRIAFAFGGSAGDIGTIRLDGTGRTSVTHDTGSGDSRPRWSPDGQLLLFQRLFLGGPSPSSEDVDPIWRVGADGSDPIQLTHSEDRVDGVSGASWAPDGSHIAYSTTLNGSYTVRVMDRDGNGDVGVSGGTWFSSSAPDWGPGSDRIVFQLETRRTTGVWVGAADGSANAPIAGSRKRPATEPDWAPCG